MSKIGNTVTQVPQGIALNEKDYCLCLLNTVKTMEKDYALAMTEASNEWLFSIYKDTFLVLADFQRKVYDLMFQNGWYQLESVEAKKLTDKYNTLDADYKGLSE